ncbi:IclR family transcriptional regulator [Bradyrhizobium prioriisuperbiae]|uniref:IclR family transcriptional regulator n=1 Tax=Bradyrhizobium prioriisuperbiae TaxID=2854389 RepID=UPI0028E5DDFC|nr:IclR family transcriptional regulator [Bradyrhizobium prioritasuperba]
MPAKSKAASTAVKSAERTLAILEYFREKKRAATVGEIAGALELPQSSTTMLLKSLLNLGYLDYTPLTRKFRPTFRVAVLGSWIQQSLFKSGPLTDIMDEIGHAIGETVLLGLQNGPCMQYVHIVPASYQVQLAAQVGILRPMTCAALGRVLLSRKSNEEIRAIVRRNNADAEDSDHRVLEREFMADIEVIRSQGFAESRGKMTPGANVIGMLVPGQPDSAPLAIGVGGPMVRIEEQRNEILRVMRRLLRET